MKLLTKEITKRLPKLYANENKPADQVQVIAKFFTPDANATWFVTEGEQQPDGDWLFFGLCDLGQGYPELGYVTLSQLQRIRGRFRLPVERDRHYRGTLADAQRSVAN